MKIAMIHGQNHKGSSYRMGRMLIEKIPEPKDVVEFFLPRDLNHFCIGCYRGIENDADCPWYAEKRAIVSAMESADLLVFTTPTYCMSLSAPMKSFLDLTFTMWMSHRPRESMFQKRAVVLSASAGSSTKGAIQGITKSLFFWGVPEIHTYGARVMAMNWDSVKAGTKAKIERDMAKLAAKLSKNTVPRVGLKTRFIFGLMANMQRADWSASPVEKEYWRERGWLGHGRPWKQAKEAIMRQNRQA